MPVLSRDQLYGDNSVIRTRSLFVETNVRGSLVTPVMGLERNARGLPNLRDFYIEFCTNDPTETDFVEHVFGDYLVWRKIKESNWMQPYLEDWQKECTTRRKSKAFKALVQEVEEGGKNAITAARFLISEPYKPKTKVEKEKVKETTDAAKNEYASDIARLADYKK